MDRRSSADFEGICRLIEQKLNIKLEEHNIKFIRELYESDGGRERLLSMIEGGVDPPPRLEQETADAEGTMSFGQTILFFSLLLSCLALVVLWFWFGPFDNQTPPMVTPLTVVLSLVCICGFYWLGIALKYYQYVILMSIVLIFALASLIGGGYARLVKEIFPNAEGNFINWIAAIGMMSAIFVGGMLIGDIGELISSAFWHLFRSHLRRKKFITACVLFLLAIIIFLFFFVLTNA